MIDEREFIAEATRLARIADRPLPERGRDMTPADLEGKTLPLDLFHFDVFGPAVSRVKLVRYGNLPDCSLPTAEYVVHRPWKDNPWCRVCGELGFLSPTREDAEKTMAHYVAERDKGSALNDLKNLVADSLPAFVSVLSRAP